jgi:hypothetical protein
MEAQSRIVAVPVKSQIDCGLLRCGRDALGTPVRISARMILYVMKYNRLLVAMRASNDYLQVGIWARALMPV